VNLRGWIFTIREVLNRGPAPVLDPPALARDITARTGLPADVVWTVLDAEEDYLRRVGIAH